MHAAESDVPRGGERPRAGASAVPAQRRAGAHAARPARRSARKPAARPDGRQVAAFRFAVIATSALLLIAVAAGAVEIHLHGFAFFVFRSTGTGETGPSGLQEDQGPGQPDAPRPTPSTVTVLGGQ